jgi:hypothetical protein
MQQHNISISIGGVNLGEKPSTTCNVTQWCGNFDDYIALCLKSWHMLTDEMHHAMSTDDEEHFQEVLALLGQHGYVEHYQAVNADDI